MTWFKVDDQLHDHRKVRKLGKTKLTDIGLWVLCGSWASDNLSDGFVPLTVVRRFDARLRAAWRLVGADLWHPCVQDGEDGFRFHQWEDHQPTKKEVQAKRDEARDRMRRVRQKRQEEGKPVRANTERTSREVRQLPSRSRPLTSSSSSQVTVATALGLKPDDDETTKVIDLIVAEHHPSALGPYLRTLADNGDLPHYLERVRAPTRSTQPTHPFTDDGTGDCSLCPMPRDHPRHDMGGTHLAVVPDTA